MNKHHLEELSEQYLLGKKLAPVTLKTYRIVFKHFIIFLKESNITFASTSDIIRYREMNRRLGHSSHWIHIQISALKGLYRYLKANQLRLDLPVEYAYDVMEKVKSERIKAQIKKPILTIAQAKHLILHTKNRRDYIWHYRDHTIIYLMLTSGLRSVEIVHAKRKDYKIINGQALLYIANNENKENQEYVKIAPGAKRAMDDYLNKRTDDNPFMFISHKRISPKGHLSRVFFINMFKRVLKDCDLEHLSITPHCLRHTAGAMNLLRGGTVGQTREFMRHADIKSTLVYVDHIERMRDNSELQIEAFLLKEHVSLVYRGLGGSYKKYLSHDLSGKKDNHINEILDGKKSIEEDLTCSLQSVLQIFAGL